MRSSRIVLLVTLGLVGGGLGAVGCGMGQGGTEAIPAGPGTHPTAKDAGHGDSTAFGTSDSSDDSAAVGASDADDSGEGAADDSGQGGGDDSSTDATLGDDAGTDAGTGSADDGAVADASTLDASTIDATTEDASVDAGQSGEPDSGRPDAGAPVDASIGDAGDAGLPRADGGPLPDAGPRADGGGACDLTGTWGTEIAIDVTWGGAGFADLVIAPGSGAIKQWILSQRVQSGGSVRDSAVLCGIELPDFQSNLVIGETYGVRFPASLFAPGLLPGFTIDATRSATTYTSTPTAVLLGLTLANPTTAAWPSTITTDVDSDGDGHRGVTAGVAQGGGYSNIPLNIFSTVRTDRVYLAIRQVTSATGTISGDCNSVTGSASVPKISGKVAIDSHIIGCGVAGSTSDCTATETSFIDGNQPVFAPNASTLTSVRLPSGATCAIAKGSLP